ncbi:MAG TPA: VOC family protein [Puia sp.]|nr:VOC family protein [Puia sp.]
MTAINPYLNFSGNTEDVFNFYKSVFGGEFATFQRFKDVPGHENLPEKEKSMIMHVALPIGSSLLMASDVLESMGHTLTTGNNFYISLNASSKAEADKIFNGLAAGGSVEMPIADMFWGAYFGMLKDKFDTRWMISFDSKQQ